MNSLTRREHGLLILAALTMIGMGYWLFRYRPVAAALETDQQRAESMQSEIETFSLPSEPVETPEQLEKQLSALKAELEQDQSRLAALKGQFVSLQAAGAVQDLRVQLSDLADRCGVQVKEFVPHELEQHAAPSSDEDGETPQPLRVDAPTLNGIYGRPLQRVVMRCGYADLKRFVDGLSDLPHRVVVVECSVERTDTGQKRPADPRPLQAEMILAL